MHDYHPRFNNKRVLWLSGHFVPEYSGISMGYEVTEGSSLKYVSINGDRISQEKTIRSGHRIKQVALLNDKVLFVQNGVFYQYDLFRFMLEDAEVKCGQYPRVHFPLIAKGNVPEGIIGLDFEVSYDPNVLKPATYFDPHAAHQQMGPVATPYGRLSLNTSVPGVVRGTLFLIGAPANISLSGSGLIAHLAFTFSPDSVAPGQVSKVSLNWLETSTWNGTTLYDETIESVFTFSNDLKGRVIYRDKGWVPVAYDDYFIGESPYYFKFKTDAQGYISDNYFVNDSLFFNKTKYRSSFEDVMGFINSTDWKMASQISNLEIPEPNIFQLLAADVNFDGKVTAGDVTLIAMRATNQTSFYDQRGRSWAWLFLSEDLLELPDFKNATRNNVPEVPMGLKGPRLKEQCQFPNSVTTYHAVLLGDVNGNWNSGFLNRHNTQEEIIIDISAAKTNENGNTIVPVYNSFSTEMDFLMEVGDRYQVVSAFVNPALYDWNMVYNVTEDGRLYLSAYAEGEEKTTLPVVYLELKGECEDLSDLETVEISAFLHGEPAKGRVGKNLDLQLADLEVFPNPSKGTFELRSSYAGTTQIKVYNTSGLEVYNASHSGKVQKIDLAELEAGVYILQATYDDVVKTQRLIKQ